MDRGVFKLQMSPSAPPDVPVILTTATEIASGMAFLHEHGIVHGDLTGGMTFCLRQAQHSCLLPRMSRIALSYAKPHCHFRLCNLNIQA